MTYQYVTKNGVLKNFEAASDAAALAAIKGFSDAAPNGGVMKAPAGSTATVTPNAAPPKPPTTEEVMAALSKNKDFQRYAGGNDAASILDAYMTGDWSGVMDLTGKPFTDEQQQAAVKAAEKVLGPAYKAAESYDRSVVEDTLRQEGEDFANFQDTEEKAFIDAKDAQDQAAADQGVLFTGARAQKLNDLRNTYEDRQRIARQQSADRTRSTVRGYQYEYGDDAARSLRDLYRLPGASGYNPNVAGGGVARSSSLSSVYNPGDFKFQGTKPVAQKAAVQTRAATTLASKANKLSLSGYGTKF
jgi:hypothetical protein